MSTKQTFVEYMSEVSMHMQDRLGFSCEDIEEFDYFAAYQNGLAPIEAAQEAVLATEDCNADI